MTLLCTPWSWLRVSAETCWNNFYILYIDINQYNKYVGINLVCILPLAREVCNIKPRLTSAYPITEQLYELTAAFKRRG